MDGAGDASSVGGPFASARWSGRSGLPLGAREGSREHLPQPGLDLLEVGRLLDRQETASGPVSGYEEERRRNVGRELVVEALELHHRLIVDGLLDDEPGELDRLGKGVDLDQ